MLGRVSCFLSNSVTLPWIVCSMGAIVLGSATGVHLKTLRHVGLAYRMPRVPHCPPPLLLLHYSTRPTRSMCSTPHDLCVCKNCGDSWEIHSSLQRQPVMGSRVSTALISQLDYIYTVVRVPVCERAEAGALCGEGGGAGRALCLLYLGCPSSTSSAENITALRLVIL